MVRIIIKGGVWRNTEVTYYTFILITHIFCIANLKNFTIYNSSFSGRNSQSSCYEIWKKPVESHCVTFTQKISQAV